MSVVKKTGRFIFYPLIKSAESLSGSGARITEAVKAIAERRRKLDAEWEAKLSTMGPPGKRFEALLVKGGWTDQELAHQAKGYRRTKWVVMITGVVSLVATTAAALFAPSLSLIILIPAGAALTGYSATQVLRHTLFLAQLRRRELISMSTLMGEPNFWSQVFK